MVFQSHETEFRLVPDGPPPPDPRLAPEAKAKRLREHVAVAVIVVICATLAVFMAVRQHLQESAEQSALAAAASDYLFIPTEPEPGAPRPRAGKVVLVDLDKRAFDHFHQSIREDLRAHSPAEVATVAQM